MGDMHAYSRPLPRRMLALQVISTLAASANRFRFLLLLASLPNRYAALGAAAGFSYTLLGIARPLLRQLGRALSGQRRASWALDEARAAADKCVC